MALVGPGGDACTLGRQWHGAAVVGTVVEKLLQQLRVPGDEPGAQAGRIGALGQAMEADTMLKTVVAHGRCGLEQARGRRGLVQIEFRVALVGGDHKVMGRGQLDQPAQGLQVQHRPAGVGRRAQIEQLAALPGGRVHRLEVRAEASLRQARQEAGFAPRPAAPRPRRSDRRGSASAPGAQRVGSTTAWAKANRASRVPLTGST